MLSVELSVSSEASIPLPNPHNLFDWRRSLEESYFGRSLHAFNAGQNIPIYSHEVWMVCRGMVQLSTIHSSGDEILTGFAFPGMPFGTPLTNLDPYQANALSDVDLMRFSLVELERSPELSQRLLNQVNRRLQQAESLIALISLKRVEDRLRQLLMLLKREIGQPTEGGTRIGVRLTHQHLANAISSTRVTVTRALGQLQEEGWLFIDRNRYIVIIDKDIDTSTIS